MLAVDQRVRKRRIGTNLVRRAIVAMIDANADEVVLETEVVFYSLLAVFLDFSLHVQDSKQLVVCIASLLFVSCGNAQIWPGVWLSPCKSAVVGGTQCHAKSTHGNRILLHEKYFSPEVEMLLLLRTRVAKGIFSIKKGMSLTCVVFFLSGNQHWRHRFV